MNIIIHIEYKLKSINKNLFFCIMEEYLEEEEKYNIFYKYPVTYITTIFLYINKNNELVNIKKQKININNSMINKDDLLYLIHHNKKKNYNIKNIIQYNASFNKEDILQNNNITGDIIERIYLKDIKVPDTISFFEDLNCLYFLMFERKTAKSTTRKNRKNRK